MTASFKIRIFWAHRKPRQLLSVLITTVSVRQCFEKNYVQEPKNKSKTEIYYYMYILDTVMQTQTNEKICRV